MLPVALLIATAWLVRCDEHIGDYIPASSIARNDFVRDEKAVAEAVGREIKLWGFVDHGNLYGDAGAKQILEEWWSSEGPNAGTWRFNLKAKADDAVGRSFAVRVPNDAGRADLLRRFAADARARTSTQVFVSGTLLTFDAPTQVDDLTGRYLELESSRDLLLAPRAGK